MRIKHSFYIVSLLMAASGIASAQSPPAAVTPPAQTAPPAPANNCSPMQPVPPRGTIAPEGSTTGKAPEPLGDKLAKSDGVLCPPAGVDPEIRAPTPETGDTPVMRPPGRPSGDPGARLK